MPTRRIYAQNPSLQHLVNSASVTTANLIMATTSTKYVRIRNIDTGTTADEFYSVVTGIAALRREKSSFLQPWRKRGSAEQAPQCSSTEEIFATSLAKQNDQLVATVTFRTADSKSKAPKSSPHKWIIDDVFNGVTILHSPLEAEIECAPHLHIWALIR